MVVANSFVFTDSRCEYRNARGRKYKFDPLANDKLSYKISDNMNLFDFYLTPCQITPKTKETNCTRISPAIQLQHGTNNCIAYLGTLETYEWSQDPITEDILLDYTYGQACLDNNYKFTIRFICDHSTKSDLFKVKMNYPTECAYEFEWKTSIACNDTI